jgi:proteasome lid subunit RPN8/RPN11
MTELRRRGEGRRETGAFLLGVKGTDKVSEFICYNDLDPAAFDSGIIMLHGDAFIPLWRHCGDHGLRVLADVHTHPDSWTGQSSSDQRHPMIAQSGHIALIIPHYATRPRQLLKGVGIHEFLGDGQWKSWPHRSRAIRFIK